MSEAHFYCNGEETSVYPFNPDQYWDNEYFTPEGSIQQWYRLYSPTEYLIPEIPDVSFQEYLNNLDANEGWIPYAINELDTMVRDNIWLATALLFDRDLNSMRGGVYFNESNIPR